MKKLMIASVVVAIILSVGTGSAQAEIVVEINPNIDNCFWLTYVSYVIEEITSNDALINDDYEVKIKALTSRKNPDKIFTKISVFFEHKEIARVCTRTIFNEKETGELEAEIIGKVVGKAVFKLIQEYDYKILV